MSNFFGSLQEQFEQALPFLPGSGDPVLRKIRREALSDAINLQFPNRKHPLWKYSQFDALNSSSIKLQKRKPSSHNLKNLTKNNLAEIPTFVFVNGFFIPELSTKIAAVSFCMKHFKTLCETKDPLIEELLNSNAKSNDVFKKLNAALVNDGGLLIIPENYHDESPILIHHYLIDRGNYHYWVSPQIHIYLEKNAKVKIIEKTTCLSSEAVYINAQTYLKLSPHSQCDYLRLDQGNLSSYTFSHISAFQGAGSQLNLHACTQNGRYHRMEIKNKLYEKNSHYSLHGLILADTFSHHDWVTRLNHLKSHCQSEQSVKSIIANDARASYLGNISVNPDSIKTLASMENFHLLLGNNGRADSSPQLEILCDDLKCNHRSSTEQLDEMLLFYIMSRGIDRKTASEMLLYAYIESFIASLSDLKTQAIAKDFIEKSFVNFQEGVADELLS